MGWLPDWKLNGKKKSHVGADSCCCERVDTQMVSDKSICWIPLLQLHCFIERKSVRQKGGFTPTRLYPPTETEIDSKLSECVYTCLNLLPYFVYYTDCLHDFFKNSHDPTSSSTCLWSSSHRVLLRPISNLGESSALIVYLANEESSAL